MEQERFEASPSEGASSVAWGSLADTLDMLAQMMNTVPDERWTPSLIDAVGTLDEAAPGCARMKRYLAEHAADPLEDVVRDLAVDWTLAFRGTNPALGPKPPYAGAWLADDGTGVQMMLTINSCYVEAGLKSSGNHLNRYDYLGVELEFLAHLMRGIDGDGSDDAAGRIVDFEDRYILSWLPRYCEHVEQCCKTEFGKGYLELVLAVLSDIRDSLAK